MIHLACRKTNNHTAFSAKARLIWPLLKECYLNNECAGCGWSFSWTNLVSNKVGGVLKVHFLSPQWAVMSGQGQAAQCVTATAPLPNDRHDLLFDSQLYWRILKLVINRTRLLAVGATLGNWTQPPLKNYNLLHSYVRWPWSHLTMFSSLR